MDQTWIVAVVVGVFTLLGTVVPRWLDQRAQRERFEEERARERKSRIDEHRRERVREVRRLVLELVHAQQDEDAVVHAHDLSAEETSRALDAAEAKRQQLRAEFLLVAPPSLAMIVERPDKAIRCEDLLVETRRVLGSVS
ncbi:MAG: hypothetical protein M3O70_26715 [Actinomycetota bacterium]|nr:hypothetical protein [Actinomycetota bacterium]